MRKYNKKNVAYLHRQTTLATIQNTNTTKRDIFYAIQYIFNGFIRYLVPS